MRLSFFVASVAGLAILACGEESDPRGEDTQTEEVADEVSPGGDAEAPKDSEAPGDDGKGEEADVPADTAGPGEIPESITVAFGERCDSLRQFSRNDLPFSDEGDTRGATNDYIYTIGEPCGGPPGLDIFGDGSPDVVYKLSPVETGTYEIVVAPDGDFDLGIMLTDQCPPLSEDGFEEMACLGASDVGRGVERLRAELVGGEDYYLLIDGWSNEVPAAGSYTMSVEFVENCSDGIDNTGNGLVDCADPQCADEPTCDERAYEGGCGNGIDDDRDGLTDCEDPDCGREPACLNLGDDFEGPAILHYGIPARGTTRGRTDQFMTNHTQCVVSAVEAGGSRSFGENAPDAVYRFTAPQTGRYLFETRSDFNDTLTVVDQQDLGGSFCFGMDRGDEGERMVIEMEAGQEVFVVVDGATPTATGDFTIVVQLAHAANAEVACGDGVDNDLDGVADCYDVDCAFDTTSCSEYGNCGDGVDNDLNGLTDCADPACSTDPHCNEAANGPDACSDGIDNDGNGLIDCFDATCAGTAACPHGAPADNCGGAMELNPGDRVIFDTCILNSDFSTSGSPGCSSKSAGSKDAVFSFTAPKSAEYVVQLVSRVDGASGFNSILNIVSGDTCPDGGNLGSCIAGHDSINANPAKVIFQAEKDQTYWFVGSAWSSITCGKLQISVAEVEPEICDDGIDNDGNGLIDCEDPACLGVGSCPALGDGETCEAPIFLELETSIATDTCAFMNVFSHQGGGCQTIASSTQGGDVLFAYEATEAGNYRFTFNSNWSNFASTVNAMVGGECRTNFTGGCDASGKNSSGSHSYSLDLELEAGETAWLVLGSSFSFECGTATAQVRKL